jgi:hypothetical protein
VGKSTSPRRWNGSRRELLVARLEAQLPPEVLLSDPIVFRMRAKAGCAGWWTPRRLERRFRQVRKTKLQIAE